MNWFRKIFHIHDWEFDHVIVLPGSEVRHGNITHVDLERRMNYFRCSKCGKIVHKFMGYKWRPSP